MPNEFHSQLIALMPKLRVQALALTRNRAAAEDLVQDAVANALKAGYTMAAAKCTSVTTTAVMWQTIIHGAFILSAIGIAYTDKLMSPPNGKRAAH